MVINNDDPVMRIVDRAMEAQTRLLMTYLGNMREQIRRDVEREVRAEIGGEQQYFGKRVPDQVRLRNEAIRRDAKPLNEGGTGLSLRALGRKYHMSKSNVALVLAEGEQNTTKETA